MHNFIPVNLVDMLEAIGENELRLLLSEFSCPLNPDIEHYLHHNAIEFAKKKTTMTYLVFDELDVFVGYFAITHKPISIANATLTNTSCKKIERHTKLDRSTNAYHASAFLIAQFGRNFTTQPNACTGEDLMKLALGVLKQVQRYIGGNIVFLECEDKPQLLQFYEREHFVPFGERKTNENQFLHQLMRFI